MQEPSSLRDLLEGEGEILELGGNQPIRLDEGESAWLVLDGCMEIFAVRKGLDDELGARVHLTSISQDQLLLSIGRVHDRLFLRADVSDPTEEVTLLAVAHPGTRLLETSRKALVRRARNPEEVPVLSAAIDRWVTSIFQPLAKRVAPKHFETLQPRTEVRLEEEEQAARSARGVVWVRHVEGSSRFLDLPELGIEPAEYLLPVSDDTWLVSRAGTVLSCVETGHLLRSGALWEGLGKFHELVSRYVGLQVRAAAEAELRRLEERSTLDNQTLDASYQTLASVLGGEATAPRAALGKMEDELLECCARVGQRQGLEIVGPPSPLEGGQKVPLPVRLRQICEASRIRNRQVLLRDDWWRHDNGPLLAFLEEPVGSANDGEKRRMIRRPVALLPTSPTAYELLDPREGSRQPVDEELAATLAAEAFMLYPVLPDRRLGPRDLLRLAISGGKKDFATIAAMGMGGGLLAVIVPVLTGELFGQVIPSADRGRLSWMVLALVASALGAAAFQITRSIAVLRLSGKIDGSLQAAVWDRVLSLPSEFFRRYTVGDLTSRTLGVDTMRTLLLDVATSFLSLVFSVFSFSLLFYYSWRLALLASALITFLVGFSVLIAWIQLRHQREILRIQGKIASMLFSIISGIGKLRVAGAEKRAFALWADLFAAQRRETFLSRRVANVQGVFNSAYSVITSLALFATMGYVMADDLGVSQFLAFSAAFGQVQSAALSAIALVSGFLTIVPVYERLRPILEEVPEVDRSKPEVGELSGEVEFSHVSFRYHSEGPLILNDVSFRARPGEFIALVGASGSGKSTSLRLLLGFEKPMSGSIYYDGQDLGSLDLQSVRRQIGVVLQNSRPMAGDILENIRGNSNLGLEVAWEAARMAGLEEDIKALPMGMHTIISEGASTFSGGQLQRLMIARAIFSRPRLIFFDEATSALDNQTQEIVSRSLEGLKATRIVIAHRLSTVRNADRIFVLDQGQLVEEGSFDELVAQGGLFARLVERQTV